MKIVLLGRYNTSEMLTGPEKVAKRLHHYLYRLTDEVTFIDYFFKHSDRRSSFFLRLFGKEKVRNDPEVIRFGIVRIFFYLLLVQPDIIHIVTSERFLIPLFCGKILLKGKLLITLHGIQKYELSQKEGLTIQKGYFKDLILEWLCFRFCDGLFFLSDQQFEVAQKFYRLDQKKTLLVPNGIDEIFSKWKDKQYPPSIFEKLKIVFIGDEGRKVKGLDFLLKSLDFSSGCIHLFIVGSFTESTKRILNNNFKGITFIKKMEANELAVFYRDKDVILSSSYYDPFPLAIIEGMASGLIPVITNNTGIKRYLCEGRNGFSYDYGNKSQLQNILSYLAVNFTKRSATSLCATDIYNTLSWEKVSQVYFDNYKKMYEP